MASGNMYNNNCEVGKIVGCAINEEEETPTDGREIAGQEKPYFNQKDGYLRQVGDKPSPPCSPLQAAELILSEFVPGVKGDHGGSLVEL